MLQLFCTCQALNESTEAGYKPHKTPIFVDVDASEAFRQWRASQCMTLTRTRTQSGGYYVTSLDRRLTTAEMLKLQGVVPENIGDTRGIPTREINASIGNAMSACVLERILPRVAWVIGHLPGVQPPRDEWSDPNFVAKGGRFQQQ